MTNILALNKDGGHTEERERVELGVRESFGF